MDIHSRRARILAMVGVLALGAASTVRAQATTNAPPKDTSAAARSDTSGYRSYQNQPDSMRTDSSGFKYNGPPTDTTLQAKPGAQTGRTAGDTTSAAGQAGGAGAADTVIVVCKDGSHAVAIACDAVHAGVDSVATKAAKKARGQPDTSYYGPDTSSSSPQ